MSDLKFFSNDIPVSGKRVVVRLDLNVPINNSKIDDDTRIKIVEPFINKLIENKAKIVDLSVCEQINNYIKENLSENIKFIEKKNKFKINIIIDNSMIISDYKIEYKNKSKKILNTLENITILQKVKEETIKDHKLEKIKKFKKRKFKKKKFFKKKTK